MDFIGALIPADIRLYLLVLLLILFNASEALSMIPKVKANGVFQAIYNGLKWLKGVVKVPAPKE